MFAISILQSDNLITGHPAGGLCFRYNRLLISMTCQVQKARFERYKRRLSTNSFCNSNATVGKHFLHNTQIKGRETVI